MAGSVKYGAMNFDPNFLFATDERGATVRFSKAERAILLKFIQTPKAVLPRDRLLDAISGPGSDASDRNIDFIINRLRLKLRDSARKPTYIATQYGEGYVWIAERATQSRGMTGVFLVVGPVRGMKHLGSLLEYAQACVQELRQAIDRKTAKESRIVVDEDCPPPEEFAGEKPSFAVELSFLNAGGQLDCAIIVRAFSTGQIIRVSRSTFVAGGGGDRILDRKSIEIVADEISTAVWDALAYRSSAAALPSAAPLAVRMHDAALLLADTSSWVETNRHLKSVLEQEPDNHQAQLMLATNIHSKYLTSGPMILPHQDFRSQDEDEIERLTLASLPHLQDNPIFVMAAGKLLYFIDRGHRPLAIDLVEQAFNATTAFATSFAVLGQIRMLEGEIDTALSLVEQGLELCSRGSEFEFYLMVLKCQALLASNRRTTLDVVLEDFYARKAGTREALSIFFTSTEAVSPEASYLLANIDETRARAMLVWSNYICARLFRSAEHRENILRAPLTLFVRQFGMGVVADDVRASVPALVSTLGAKDDLCPKAFSGAARASDRDATL